MAKDREGRGEGSGAEDDETDREDLIRDRLRGILVPGDSLIAACDEEDGGISVGLGRSRSAIAESHPELYGALRCASEGVRARGGCSTFLASIVAGGALLLAVHRGWIPTPFAGRIDPPIAILALIACGWLASAFSRLARHLAYRQTRGAIAEALARSGLSTERLLAEIAPDRDLDRLIPYLAHDPELARGER